MTAAAYAHADRNWEFARLPRRSDDLLLDVATGSGTVGRALAADVRQVIGVDIDISALVQGRHEAAAAGVANMLFMRGDATALPFLDASFRVATCGFALHHIGDPGAVLTELRRVLEPGGWLGIADVVAPESPEVAARQNAIERRRHPGFTRALSASALQDTLVRHGFEVTAAESRERRQSLEDWLAHAHVHAAAREDARSDVAQIAAAIRAELSDELDGGPETGLAPRVEADASLSIAYTQTELIALCVNG